MNGWFAIGVWQLGSVSFWLNSVSLILLLGGLVLTLLGRSTPLAENAPGLSTLIQFGPVFFAVPLAIFGMQHFALRDAVVQGVPSFMPMPMLWVWLVGAGLIAASLSIITGKVAHLAALLVGLMLLSFVLMIYIPKAMMNPGNRFAYALLFRDLSLSGGALALAGTLAGDPNARSARGLRLAGRCFFGTAMIVFGIENFLHPHNAPGVPLPKMMPAWIPGHLVWAWLTGAVLIVGGLGILLNKRGSLAAVVVGMIYLALVVFVYMPMEILHPSIQISGELDYAADTLIFTGAAFFIAASLRQFGGPAPILRSRVSS